MIGGAWRQRLAERRKAFSGRPKVACPCRVLWAFIRTVPAISPARLRGGISCSSGWTPRGERGHANHARGDIAGDPRSPQGQAGLAAPVRRKMRCSPWEAGPGVAHSGGVDPGASTHTAAIPPIHEPRGPGRRGGGRRGFQASPGRREGGAGLSRLERG